MYFENDCENLIFFETNKLYFCISFISLYYYYVQPNRAPIHCCFNMLKHIQWGLNRQFIYCCKGQRYNITHTIPWVPMRFKIFFITPAKCMFCFHIVLRTRDSIRILLFQKKFNNTFHYILFII